ncbi:hypothetical protein QUB80_14530 [Chlorogloeopsis sp. ULAP01]|uniref:hypothetical protein n=1 Tax=Chlorogloeopsis sp. ULAP01 TaxID=3056483 RepID=UPI0025AAA913|nr:hypothetical protein [Chlorogloeopsis sp. ULAP01]MDM9381918.1 hypothetical protein [Chlorogloeopsis sp. ULAP01]
MQSIPSLTDNQNHQVSGLQEEIKFSGIQFLKNFLDRKTAVLIDLKEHGELWAEVEEEIDIPLSI